MLFPRCIPGSHTDLPRQLDKAPDNGIKTIESILRRTASLFFTIFSLAVDRHVQQRKTGTYKAVFDAQLLEHWNPRVLPT